MSVFICLGFEKNTPYIQGNILASPGHTPVQVANLVKNIHLAKYIEFLCPREPIFSSGITLSDTDGRGSAVDRKDPQDDVSTFSDRGSTQSPRWLHVP